MVKDLRKQKRTIRIEFEKIGYNYDLDRFVDILMRELTIITEQREKPDGLKIEIILE